jgi:heat-inducible transcriptional repressor
MKPPDSRVFEILDAVVRLNIETGRPVSSSLVSRSLQGAFSPATIRIVMRALEENGFLVKPHPSAGRLPTDEGFRAFVDRILETWPLQQWQTPPGLAKRIEADLRRSADTGNLIKVLATHLSQLTANISIILGPSIEAVRAVRLDLYPKEGRRILIVLVFENALVRSGQFTLDRFYSPAVIKEAGRILSERVSGRTPAEIRSSGLASLGASSSAASRCAFELSERGREIFEDVEEGELKVDGVANVLTQPEFSEPGPLKSLVLLVGSPPLLREALHLLNRESEGALRAWIGAENPIGELQPFSLLSCPFAHAGRQGILAVLGPRRMAYHRALSGIDVLRQTLQAIS